MSVVTTDRPSLLHRIRRWYRDFFGITEAEASLERTREARRAVRSDMTSTTALLRHARRTLASQGWDDLYRDRMQDFVE